MNRLVMDYLVVEGYKEAAENFAREAGMSAVPDLQSIQNRMMVRNAIQRGDIVEAIEQVNDLNPEVSYVALVREGRLARASECFDDYKHNAPLSAFSMLSGVEKRG